LERPDCTLSPRVVTGILGVKSEEVTYKEDVWVGGGNAGPDVECIVGGLEVGTLVFMQYKVVGDEFVKLPIRTVDTATAWIGLRGFHKAFQVVSTRSMGNCWTRFSRWRI